VRRTEGLLIFVVGSGGAVGALAAAAAGVALGSVI
jgi:hypothetical protein